MCLNTRMHPHGRVLVFEMMEGEREHQNVPLWACSGVRDVGNVFGGWGTALVRGEGEGACPTAKTRPSGHVFGVRHDVEWEGTCPTAKARPQGRAFGVRRDVKETGRAQQQKHALLGVFLAFGAM